MRKLGISKITLYNYVKSGKIKVNIRYSKVLIIYDDDSVNAHVNSTNIDAT